MFEPPPNNGMKDGIIPMGYSLNLNNVTLRPLSVILREFSKGPL